MTVLFQRDWRILVDRQVFTEHRCTFAVEKTTKREPNSCSIKIWNLSALQRDTIQGLSLKPRTGGGAQTGGRIRVELEAGYVGARHLIFRGDLRTAQSVRDGADWITTIEGEDGGRSILSARVNQSFPEGTPVASVVRACAQAMGLGLGNLNELAAAARTRGGETFAHGTVLSGKADQELTQILASCGLTWSVQQGNLQLLRAGQALSTSVLNLRAGTGLIGSPVVNPDGTVEALAQLVPGLFPGGRTQLASLTASGVFAIKKLQGTGDTHGLDWGWQLECKP